MTGNTYNTQSGDIRYWIDIIDANAITLVFLPGLTTDHRLFDKQIEYFKGTYNLFVWDPPAHASSWPFTFYFNLFDKARWVNEILEQEKLKKPVIIGQSMGAYVGQAFLEAYPEKLKGFISIDSAPLQKKYYTGIDLWLLKRMEPMYLWFSWESLMKWGAKGTAESEYGRKLIYEIMTAYDGDKKRFAKIAGHGFKIVAEAIEKNLPYNIKCPALLICGEKDKAGSTRRFNKAWHKDTGIPIEWIKNAGHNANTDKPEEVNKLIEQFVASLKV